MTPSTRPSNQRRTLLVRPTYQWQATLVIIALCVVFALVQVLLIHIAISTTLTALELKQEVVFLAVSRVVLWTAVAELVVVLPIIAIIGIRLTHLVVGPFDRVLAALNEMAHGNYEVRLQLRKADVLRDIAEAVNRLAASLRRKRHASHLS